MAATISKSTLTRTTPVQIIAEYCKGDGPNAIQLSKIWNLNARRLSNSEFVDWLLNEKIIDFCRRSFSGYSYSLARTVAEFTRYIRPLLEDMASMPDERDFLLNLVNRVREVGHFLTFTPQFSGKTKWSSCAFQGIQGVPLADLYNNRVLSPEKIALIRSKIDSYGVILVMDEKIVTIMEDTEKRLWYAEILPLRRILLHELVHVQQFLDPQFQRRVAKESEISQTYRYTDLLEEHAISVENKLAPLRKEKERVSHLSINSEGFFSRQSTDQLFNTVLYGLNGTLDELLEDPQCVPGLSDPRLPIFLEVFGKTFCHVIPAKKRMKTRIDLEYYEKIIKQKKDTLLRLIHYLLNRERFDNAALVLGAAIKESGGAQEVLPFLKHYMQLVIANKIAYLEEDNEKILSLFAVKLF